MTTEWQAFVGRRFNEDLHLLQDLSTAKAPDEVWNAWSRFWQKAGKDYGAEYTVFAKLAADLVPSGIAIREVAAGKDTRTMRQRSKAA